MDHLMEARQAVAHRMGQIAKCFKPGVKITVAVRTPGFPERDFLMTDDDMPEAILLIQRRMAGSSAPVAETTPTRTKDDWLGACAARFQARGAATSDDAWKLARVCFDATVQFCASEEGALAFSPEEAADEEISSWEGR